MNKLKNAVIFGLGRCGSHWVESIMIDLLGGIGRSNKQCPTNAAWMDLAYTRVDRTNKVSKRSTRINNVDFVQ